jgi:hypothetical protein
LDEARDGDHQVAPQDACADLTCGALGTPKSTASAAVITAPETTGRKSRLQEAIFSRIGRAQVNEHDFIIGVSIIVELDEMDLARSAQIPIRCTFEFIALYEGSYPVDDPRAPREGLVHRM